MRYLIVVDMQNDFIDGSLGTKEAQGIVERVAAKARTFDGKVVFTLDTHGAGYLNTQEGALLPVEHCIKGTDGWQLAPALEQVREERDARCFEKGAFGSLELATFLAQAHTANPIESIELVGLCTDICVVSNALIVKAQLPEVPVLVDASCCAGVTPEAHAAALATMKSCQVIVENDWVDPRA